MKHSVFRILVSILIIVNVWFAYTAAQIYRYSFESFTTQSDTAIVLGAAVWRDSPSPIFRERIRHAVALYNSGRVESIIFTGGYGLNDRRAESEVGKSYATMLGVPEASIFIETASATTYENLIYGANIVSEQEFQSALLVSDPLHMRRAVEMAGDLGLTVLPSPTQTSRYITWRSRSLFLMRETYLYTTYQALRLFNRM